MIALDLETHKIQPGLLAPPIVCGSTYDTPRTDLWEPCRLWSREQIVQRAREHLLGPEVIAGANVAYDFACLAALDPTLLPLIFA